MFDQAIRNLGSESALIAVPALFWAAYTYQQDRHQPEPWTHLVMAIALGMLAGCLSQLGYQLLESMGLRFNAYQLAEQNRLALFAYSVFGIGVVEESAKLIPFWIVLTRLKAFDEVMDGIVYASFVAIGFASYENVFYLAELDGFDAVGRAFATPGVHMMFASIWGYTVARARLSGRPLLPAALLGLGISAIAHGVYDYVAIGVPELQATIPAAIIAVIWIWRLDRVQQLEPNCGTPTTQPC